METKKLIFLSAVTLASLFISFVILAQLIAPNDEQFTQAELVEALVKALGIGDQLGPIPTTEGKAEYLEHLGYAAHTRTPELVDLLGPAATTKDKADFLESLGYAPPGGWELGKTMTKGDIAVVLGKIFGIGLADDATADDYIELLANLGIMASGEANSPFLLDDLASAINIAAELPDVEVLLLQPYHAAMSPIK